MFTVASLGRGEAGPGSHHPGGDSPFLRLNLQKYAGQTINWKAERVGVVTVAKKIVTFFVEK